MPEQLLKRWNDWSAGVGYLVDDGRTPGMYTALALLGTRGELRPAPVLTQTGTPGGALQHNQYFLSEPATNVAAETFLYSIKNDTAYSAPRLHKWDGRNATFMADLGSAALPNTAAGTPERYQGFWYHGMVNADLSVKSINKLTVVSGSTDGDFSCAIGQDTHNATAVAAAHLTYLNSQLVAQVPTEGVRILKIDGNPQTDGDWGSYFEVGDKNDRARALASLQGASFVLNVDGLYSFDANGRARQVFRDFRTFRSPLRDGSLREWRGGLVMGHPTGLLYYQPGLPPINIGVDAVTREMGSPPSGPTELRGGKYHGLVTAGDFIYALYAPDLSTLTALLLVGTEIPDSDRLVSWQVAGEVNLQNAELMQGIGFIADAYPVSATITSPILIMGDDDAVSYMILSPRGSVFRARADTHKVALSGDAYMSELRFPKPVDLSKVVVYTSTDMASGDEYQLSLITNGTGRDENVGAPIKGSGSRHERKVDRSSVTSMVLHINWAATSTSARVPPVIMGIELYGDEATRGS